MYTSKISHVIIRQIYTKHNILSGGRLPPHSPLRNLRSRRRRGIGASRGREPCSADLPGHQQRLRLPDYHQGQRSVWSSPLVDSHDVSRDPQGSQLGAGSYLYVHIYVLTTYFCLNTISWEVRVWNPSFSWLGSQALCGSFYIPDGCCSRLCQVNLIMGPIICTTMNTSSRVQIPCRFD